MISQPCRECGNTFWIDEDTIPEEVDKQLPMRVTPYCNGKGHDHSFRLWGVTKPKQSDDDVTIYHIRS